MALQLPFKKKKEKPKTAHEIKHHIEKLKGELKVTAGTEAGGDPVLSRLNQFGFAHPIRDKKGEITGWHGQEKFEKFQHRIVPTEFPAPDRRFRLVLEYPKFNIEQTYYWFLRYFNESW